MKFLLVMVAAVTCFGGDGCEVEQVGKSDVRIETALKKNELIISAFSKSGIGGCRVRKPQSSFPATVKLRLFYEEGKPFKRLEGLRIKTDGFTAEWLRARKELHVTDGNGKKQVIKANTRKNANVFELELPAKLLKESTAVEMCWVDAYR